MQSKEHCSLVRSTGGISDMCCALNSAVDVFAEKMDLRELIGRVDGIDVADADHAVDFAVFTADGHMADLAVFHDRCDFFKVRARLNADDLFGHHRTDSDRPGRTLFAEHASEHIALGENTG